MLPAAVAIAMFGFIGAFGSGAVPSAYAAEGDICEAFTNAPLGDPEDDFDGQGNAVHIVDPGVRNYLVFFVEDQGSGDQENVEVRIDSETGSARITSYAEISDFGADADVYHRLVGGSGVGSQMVDTVDPDDFDDPDGNPLDDVNLWLEEVVGISGFVPLLGEAVPGDEDYCGGEDDDAWGFIDFECIESGYFHIDVLTPDDTEETGYTLKFYCTGQADRAEISASPTTVETYPAALDINGNPTINRGESTIVVTVWDQFDDRIDGVEVTFTTDNCSFIRQGSSDFSPAGGGTTVTTTTDSDTTQGPNNDAGFLADNPLEHAAGTAEVILNCDGPGPRGNPGVANITAVVDRPGSDIVLKTTVTVVGPTSATGLTLTLTPDDVECGETILATAKAVDAQGAAVSNGTWIFFTTDTSSGVVGGAEGAQGSAQTVAGEASVLIATDPGNSGIHTVIAYVVNAAGVPSAQVSATYTCDAAVAPAAPTVAPPSTGTGTGSITPPNTGDAGLASPPKDPNTFAFLGLALLASVALFALGQKAVQQKG
jgi:hypothetical protein